MQYLISLFHAFEFVKSGTTRPNFADSLRTAQHQDAHHRKLSRTELQDFWCDVLVFGHAAGAAMEDVREILFAQAVERAINFYLSQRHHRMAIVFLITRRRQRIEREGIVFRRRDLFFNQRTERADFVWG